MNALFDAWKKLGCWATCLLFILSIAPPSAHAQKEELTLEEAVRSALAANERAAAADELFAAAKARLSQARSFFLPNIVASGTYIRRPFEVKRDINDQSIVIQSYNALAGVAQVNLTLFDAHNIPSLLKARSERNSQQYASAESKRQLAFEVSNAFLSTLGIDQVMLAAQHRYEFGSQALDAARARFAAGLVSVNDVTRAELEFATAEMGLTQVKGQVETAFLQLGNLLNDLKVSQKTLLVPEFLLEAAEKDQIAADDLIVQAQDRRLDVNSLRWLAKAQRALALEPMLNWLPSLAFNSQFRYSNETGLTGRPTNWNVGLTMTWSLFDGFNRNAGYRERKALSVVADLNVRSALKKVELEVREALVSLTNQRATLKQAAIAHEVAKKNAAETAELYRQGLSTALQVADANVSLFEAEVELARQRFGLGISYLNLEAALGLDPFGKEPQL